MVTLARCCSAATATTSSTIPYRRLKQQSPAPGDAAAGRFHAQEDERAPEQLRAPLKRSVASRARSGSEDTVVLKVAMVGDSESGKSCFTTKYVSNEFLIDYEPTKGMAVKEKSMRILNAKIVFSIWELGGGKQSQCFLPRACDGAAAVIFMFDLTKRSTLKSVKEWFVKTKQINSCAISVLAGTKYDQFIDFPVDIQLAITKQAMFYAETMGAALFFSSTTHNINVNKIFKVIVAKVFDLRCNVSRNLKPGEPIVFF